MPWIIHDQRLVFVEDSRLFVHREDAIRQVLLPYNRSQSVTRSSASYAYDLAFGPRHLCGSCHARRRDPGDWLCKQCRDDIAEFESEMVIYECPRCGARYERQSRPTDPVVPRCLRCKRGAVQAGRGAATDAPEGSVGCG